MDGKDLPVVVTGVTVIWASPRFGQPYSQKPSDMGILCNVSVKSKLLHAPPPPPGHLTFLKIIVQIPPYPGQNAVQMPHTGVHSGDQMPPPRGHFTGTKMTERQRKHLQLSNKILIYKYNKN